MLDSWKKNKFYSKCKSTIGQTKTRIEMIRKKRNSTQKYLKNDIADLIKSGLDRNAYDRTDGLLVELNLLSCYDFLDQYCEQILSHLDTISTQRECPENCKEPVGSLMFAAARLADLPELRQLRTMFNERYGNSLESCVNNQFAAKLKPVPHKMDVKLQLMQDIAAEYDVEWNSKALQQMLYEQEHADVASNKKESEDALSNPDNVKSASHRNRGGPSGRTTSLPVELEQISPEELMKGHTRASSCTPDMFGHVHPRVPNYEEVIARLTDLGGKSKE